MAVLESLVKGPAVRSERESLLKKVGPNLVACGPIFGAIVVAERSALSDHTFSKGPHSWRDRFTGLQEASHYSQLFEDLGGVSMWFHRQMLRRRREATTSRRP